MIDLIAASLKRMHRLYASFPKGLWGLCVSITFMSLAFGFFCSLIVTWLAWKLNTMVPGFIQEPGDFFMVSLYWDGTMRISAFTLLALGLFALRMRQVGDLTLTDIKAATIWKEVGAKARNAFGWSLLVLMALQVLLFRTSLDADDTLNATFWPDATFHPSLGRQYLNWLYSVARLAMNYMPYLMVLNLCLAHDGMVPSRRAVAQHLPVMGAVFIIGTVIDALHNECHHLLITYVFPPLIMPFGNSAFTYLFPFMVVLMFTAWAVPAICLAMTGPLDAFKAHHPDEAGATLASEDTDEAGLTPP